VKKAFVLPDEEKLIRIEATDPSADAWVSANAGSGKTTLLGQRVIRLLLAGTPPERILCLTFTKAAAAEMQARVFRDLAAWAMLDDGALTDAIAAISTTKPEGFVVDRPLLARARTLFARAIETPGGLKIQTIHAFAERILHLFPIEAGVPLGFTILEEAEAGALMDGARRAAIDAALAAPASGLARAFRAIVDAVDPRGFGAAIRGALAELTRLAQRGEALPDPERRLAQYRAVFGVPDGETLARINADFDAALMPPGLMREAAAAIRARKGASDTQRINADAFEALARRQGDDPARFDAALALFLNGDQDKARRALIPAYVARPRPDLAEAASASADACLAILERRRALFASERSLALAAFAEDVMTRYAAVKRARGVLDFDDLIGAVRRLLLDGHAAWLMLKLDAGIEHVLVDEAQDTTREMWDIIRALTEEFFAGKGQVARRRTIFVVGDEKQSIYSFQGADPQAFEEARAYFAARAPETARIANPIRLTYSFRSTETILAGVDQVFAGKERAFGLGAGTDPVRHTAARAREPGLVEFWPAETGASPAGDLADRIAETIATWFATGERHQATGEPIRPGDILILVRQRNAFFSAMLKALKRRQLPVSGADRLKLQAEIGVRDLLVIAEAMLNEADDLALATALKSPLFGLDEADIETLCRDRPGSLRQSLEGRADDPRFAPIVAAIRRYAALARTAGPFTFFASLMVEAAPGSPGKTGRQALLTRLGVDAGEPLDAFLVEARGFERLEPASLLAFVAAERRRETVIKRDLEQGGDRIRVMTVHGAKGLEARIVFLGDTLATPDRKLEPNVLLAPTAGTGVDLPVWAGRKREEPAALRAIRERLREKTIREYRRLLYVAMTRAADRLYVSGYARKSKERNAAEPGYVAPKRADTLAELTWYHLIEDGVKSHADTRSHTTNRFPAPVLRLASPFPAAPALARPEERRGRADLPPELRRPLRDEPDQPSPLRPSRAGVPAANVDMARETGVTTRRGILLHRLAEFLPRLPPPARSAAAHRLLHRLAPDISGDEADRMAAPLLALLAGETGARLFGPDARAEVGLAGEILLPGGARRAVLGRVDRLLVCDGRVEIADLKTGRARRAADDPAIMRQMALYRALLRAIYPDRPVISHIAWSETGVIETLDNAALDLALGRITEP
jgi:ATP-dependent helicase/nuclease subunit A